MFTSASSNDVLTVNGTSPDASGNVTVTVGNDHSTEISNLTTRVTTLELGGGGDTGSFSPPEVLWERAGTSTIRWVGHTTNGYNTTTSPHMTDFLGKYGDYYKLEVHVLNGGVEEFFIEDIHTNSLLRRRREITNGQYGNATHVGQLDTLVSINDQGNMTIYISNSTIGNISDVSIQRILVYKNPLGGPSDISQLNDSTGLLSSGGGGGLTTQKVFTASTTWTVPAGVDKVKISVTAAGDRGGSDGNTSLKPGGAGGTAIAIFSVTSGETLTMTLGASKSNSWVEISGRTGNIAGFGAQGPSGGHAHCTITTGLIGDALLIDGGTWYGASNYSMNGAPSIYGIGPAYGGGSNKSSWSNNQYTQFPGVAVVVLEY